MGKLIGAIVGALVFNIVGFFIGLYLGHLFDQKQENGGFSGQHKSQIARVVFETQFRLLGHLAKADGVVTKDEIQQTEAIIQQARLGEGQRAEAIALFKEGMSSNFVLEHQISAFLAVCQRRTRLKQTLIVYLINMALADGKLHPAEQRVLSSVSQTFGIPNALLDHFISMIAAQRDFTGFKSNSSSSNYRQYQNNQGTQQNNPHHQLQLAYQALGVTASASDSEVKKAFRKLMSENHPDKLMGQGVPESMIEQATERSKKISMAYDLIKEQRKR